jgi:hypothetical protein
MHALKRILALGAIAGGVVTSFSAQSPRAARQRRRRGWRATRCSFRADERTSRNVSTVRAGTSSLN